MKAFSVWPAFEGNIAPSQMKIINQASRKVLEEAGYEYFVEDQFEAYDECSRLLLKNFVPKTRWYCNWSDYIRLTTIQGILEEGETALYVDYDMVILRAPKSPGCAMEIHLQTEGDNPEIVKFWFRGVNCTYLLHPEHLPMFTKHLTAIQDHIRDNNGKVQFTYPMNYMSFIEEEIGYIPNYFHFGDIEDPDFCSVDKILDSVEIYAKLTGHQDRRIDAVNAMGTRAKEGVANSTFELTTYRDLNDFLALKEWTRDSTRNLFRKMRNSRIRPNYNSHKMRELIKKEIKSATLPKGLF